MALNILLVDDSKIVRSVIAKTLKLADIRINELYNAGDGIEALKILKDNWIDLVFTDINMPGMDGIQLINAMAEQSLLESIPVIVITTEGNKNRIDSLKEKGISAYIRKPFTPEQLKSVVEEILGELPNYEEN